MYNRLAEIINWYFSPVQGAADAARTGLGVLPARSSANGRKSAPEPPATPWQAVSPVSATPTPGIRTH